MAILYSVAVRERVSSRIRRRMVSRWTGGALFVASLPSHVSLASRQIVSELRQQYLIAVEPSNKPGWHQLEVRTRDKRLTVRTRSGYLVGPDVSNQ